MKKFDHTTPVLRELHWLRVRQRVQFNSAMTDFISLHGLAPSHLADGWTLVSSVPGRSHLRSTAGWTCSSDTNSSGTEELRRVRTNNMERFAGEPALSVTHAEVELFLDG